MEDKEIFESWEEFKDLLKKTKRANIENLIKWLDESDFKFAPASSQYHNSFRGGLLKHSLNVYYAMRDDFKEFIDFFELTEDTVIITSLLHDVCKVNCYEVSYRNVKDEEGNWTRIPYYAWNELEPLGHGEKSVMLINEQGVQLSKVERAMIRNHMGFAEEGDSRRVGKLFRICPQSVVLSCADLEATMILESYDGPQRFRDKLIGESIVDTKKKANAGKEFVDLYGTKYQLAPKSAEVDNNRVIEIPVKVYTPYGDGLPF